MKLARSKSRRGAVAVIVAVCLTLIVAVVAIAMDGGTLLDDQRQCQAGADAAALAAACDLYANYPTNQGKDSSGTAAAAALAAALANGYNNDGVTNKVTVNIPPKYPAPWDKLPYQPYLNKDSYVEVIVEYYQPRGFSGLLGSGNLVVKARTIARGAWESPRYGVLVLDPTAPRAMNDGGNGLFVLTGGTLIVDSSDPNAAYIGGGGSIQAQEYDITGSNAGKPTGFENPAGSYDPSIINTGVPPTPDPFAYLPAPGEPGGAPIPPAANVLTQGNTLAPTATSYLDITQVPAVLYNHYYVLKPGSYGGPGQPKLPNFTNGDLVVLQQASAGNGGIYYLTSGGFTANGADIRMDPSTSGGIMLYNAGTGSSDGVSLAGTSTSSLVLGPLTSGIYSGLTIFQARNAPEDLSLTGNGAFSIDGTIYTADGTLKVTGNGGAGNIGSQFVSRYLTIGGGGNVVIDYAGKPKAKVRIVTLVE